MDQAGPVGAVAQLGERLVRNEEVSGSIPLSSTKSFHSLLQRRGNQISVEILVFLSHICTFIVCSVSLDSRLHPSRLS
jgi:hypothetical protein